jgi:ribose transport system substrate-binding protein
MKKTYILTTVACLLTVAALAGAAMTKPSASAGASTAAGKHYNIALVTGDNHDPFYVTMNQGAQAEARKLGVSVKWQGPAQFEAQLQIPILDAVLASKPDFLLVAPDDVRALINPLRQFNKKKIPVVTVDTDVSDHSVRLGNVTSDNKLGGAIAARFLAKALHNTGKVLYVGPQPGVFTTDQRKVGFEAALKKYQGLKYVGPQFDNDDPNQVTSVVSAVLQRHPDLKGIFASDTFNGQGAATAVSNAGKRGRISIVEFDAEPDQVSALKRGIIQALIVQKAYDMGVTAVDYAVKHLKTGFKIPAETHPTYVIATKANINSPGIAKYIYHQK